jgi:hypothetical protein
MAKRGKDPLNRGFANRFAGKLAGVAQACLSAGGQGLPDDANSRNMRIERRSKMHQQVESNVNSNSVRRGGHVKVNAVSEV